MAKGLRDAGVAISIISQQSGLSEDEISLCSFFNVESSVICLEKQIVQIQMKKQYHSY